MSLASKTDKHTEEIFFFPAAKYTLCVCLSAPNSICVHFNVHIIFFFNHSHSCSRCVLSACVPDLNVFMGLYVCVLGVSWDTGIENNFDILKIKLILC